MPANAEYGNFNSVGINPNGPNVGGVLVAAATIAPTHRIHHISGVTPITNITPPYPGFTGKLTFIADAAIVMNTGGNIAAAIVGVAAKSYEMVYDGVMWYSQAIA